MEVPDIWMRDSHVVHIDQHVLPSLRRKETREKAQETLGQKEGHDADRDKCTDDEECFTSFMHY
jgi:hypothetical protein